MRDDARQWARTLTARRAHHPACNCDTCTGADIPPEDCAGCGEPHPIDEDCKTAELERG